MCTEHDEKYQKSGPYSCIIQRQKSEPLTTMIFNDSVQRSAIYSIISSGRSVWSYRIRVRILPIYYLLLYSRPQRGGISISIASRPSPIPEIWKALRSSGLLKFLADVACLRVIAQSLEGSGNFQKGLRVPTSFSPWNMFVHIYFRVLSRPAELHVSMILGSIAALQSLPNKVQV